MEQLRIGCREICSKTGTMHGVIEERFLSPSKKIFERYVQHARKNEHAREEMVMDGNGQL